METLAKDRIRKGKTARDREKGEAGRREANRSQRVAWQHSWLSKGGKAGDPFPRHTCNGRKNRYRVTGKNGESVIVH